jgi:autophagy-related protein 11
MSLNIYIAHTGEHLLADPVSFASYVFLLLVYPCRLRSARPSLYSYLIRCESLLTLFISPSPDALRTWIARHTSIPAQRQILMTARGKNVRIQSLATEVR